MRTMFPINDHVGEDLINIPPYSLPSVRIVLWLVERRQRFQIVESDIGSVTKTWA